MKKHQKNVLLFLLITALIGFVASQSAQAAGTASGTVITNNATLVYEVGGVGQAPITDATPPQFVVDNRVDLVVAEDTGTSGYTDVNPNTTDQVLTFTVSNTGNTVQDFDLAAAPGVDPHGGADNFDASNLGVFVESGATVGFQALEDTATYIDELAPWVAAGDEVTVYVVADIAISQLSGDIAAYTLTATARAGGGVGSLGGVLTETVGPDTPGAVDIVFGDAAGDTDAAEDAAHSDSDAYRVLAAQLSIDKSSTVIRDPFNDGVNPKHIPGAYVQHVITISNAATATAPATLTSITDTLDANVAIDPDLIVGATGVEEDAVGSGFRVDHAGTTRTAPVTPQYFTTTSSVDGVDHDGSATGGVVSANMALVLPADPAAPTPYAAGELRAGESVTLTFNVIIQ